MDIGVVVERVRRVGEARAVPGPPASIEAALADVRSLRAWLDGSEAALVSALGTQVSFPEAAIASVSKESLGAAGKTLDRARTLEAAPSFADALDDGTVTAGHVDEITRAGTILDDRQRSELIERCAALVDVAEHATVDEWRRRVRDEARRISADDEMSRLERQRQATSLRTWVDNEGMWNLRGRFDPMTGVRISARLERAMAAMFAEHTPTTCPSDPIEKQHHLRALTLDRLLTDATNAAATGPRASRPEFVVVIDTSHSLSHSPSSDIGGGDASGSCDDGSGVEVSWPIPVEVPWRVLAELAGDGDVHAVVVRNGVVLHAPGRLDLGRTTRLANRAQRRALRGFYATCGIPGCGTHYDRCKLHHVIWWRHGGRTDLDNLLPLCSLHHGKIHDGGWVIELGPDRRLTLRLPDGTIHNSGPPHRRSAA